MKTHLEKWQELGTAVRQDSGEAPVKMIIRLVLLVVLLVVLCGVILTKMNGLAAERLAELDKLQATVTKQEEELQWLNARIQSLQEGIKDLNDTIKEYVDLSNEHEAEFKNWKHPRLDIAKLPPEQRPKKAIPQK